MSQPSTIRMAFARTTGFLSLPVTILLVLVYLAVALSTLITDQLASIPSPSTLQSKYGGLNVSEAYEDLHVITARPHPYHSHANDVVRDYLLRRVRTLQMQSGLGGNFIIDDDLITNGSWASNFGVGSATYFEGNNILVKIRGTSEHNLSSTPPPAVLFSAHFDSTSTSYGVTDDGMGTVTLLQLIKYFAAHQPFRTVLFNINNGEEDGLNGAHALLEHPWIKNTSHPEFVNLFGSTFINLEGAGSGGRPLAFRATDLVPVKSWKNVDRPHANIISAEAFKLGIIRSWTDYSVYTSPLAAPRPQNPSDFAPMRGIDFAFYRGRSKYHTKFDAIPYTEGDVKALWAMVEPSWATGVALANDENVVSPAIDEKAVFFELFNTFFVVFRLTHLLTFNITALVVGPIVLILLAISESSLAHSRAVKRQQATYSPTVAGELEIDPSASEVLSPGTAAVEEESFENRDVQHVAEHDDGSVRRKAAAISGFVWKHARFWVALILAIAAQAALVVGFIYLNSFVVYRAPAIPVLSSFVLSILVFSLVLSPPRFFLPASRIRFLSRAPTTTDVPAWTSFRTLLIHNYVFTWLLVLLSTVATTQFGIGGVLYMASACNGLLWLAAVICGIAGCFGIAETAELEVVKVEDSRGDQSEEVHPNEQDPVDVNERTPLVGRKRLLIVKNKSKAGIDPNENPQPYVLWILVLLIIVPFPLILISHIALFLIPSVNQTMVDGSPAWFVYALISFLSFVAAIPVIPFVGARRIHRYLLWVFAVVWVVCIAVAWIPWYGPWVGSDEGFKGGLFPFSEDAPLKVFFQQRVKLTPSGNDSGVNARIMTTLAGPIPFLQNLILPQLPSYLESVAGGRETGCSYNDIDQKKSGLGYCRWETYNSEADSSSVDALSMIPVASHDSSSVFKSMMMTKNRTSWDWKSTKNSWFKAQAKQAAFNGSTKNPSARFVITGNNSRVCRVYFDQPIERFRVRTIDVDDYQAAEDIDDGDDGRGWEVQRGFESKLYEHLRLWTRQWGRTFVVDVQWPEGSSSHSASGSVEAQSVLSDTDGESQYTGRVACEWAEYESGMIGMGLSTSPVPSPSDSRLSGGKIPAFEEVLAFLPKWATVSKLVDGLVEAEENFGLSY